MNATALDALLHWLLRTSLEASVLILAVLGLRLALGPRLTPPWRIGLWMLVGLKLLLPACIPASFGLGNWGPQSLPAMPRVEAVPTQQPAAEMVPRAVELAETSTGLETTAAPEMEATTGLAPLLLTAWLLGAALVLGTAWLRQAQFEKRLRRQPRCRDERITRLVDQLARQAGVRQQVRVVMMPPGTTPAVVGFSRARLLLPEDWESRFDAAALRHVLLHELLHVRQGDLLWNWAALGVQALHWFNPLVWVVVARFQADRELRCDAGALALLSPNERLAYGHTLLRIQETFSAPPAVAGLAPCVRNHPTLRQRIHMIAQPTRNRPWIHAIFAAAFGVMACYAFTTARAAEGEKEIPAKDRSREGERAPATPGAREGEGAPKPGMREGEGAARKTGERDGERKPGMRDGEGAASKTGERDGERKPGMRDGEGAARKTGERDGERKPGMRDGEGERKGPRDGEKPRTGERDGEKPRTGERDGERKPGAREGDKNLTSAATSSAAGQELAIHITAGGDVVKVGAEEVPANRLRGLLNSRYSGQEGVRALITADDDVSFKALMAVRDAVSDNGIKAEMPAPSSKRGE